MKILAVEFSSSQRSVAIAEIGSDGQSILLGGAGESGGFRALGLVEEALLAAKCEREDIGAIVVGLGPGSYTGIRGAIALAQGWQLGRDVLALGISSVECLAEVALRENVRGPSSIIIDAQRAEFYLARYELSGGSASETESLHLASIAEIQALSQGGANLFGPDLAEIFPSAKPLFPDAAGLAALAAGRKNFVPAEKLEPIYLRQTAFIKAPPPRIVP